MCSSDLSKDQHQEKKDATDLDVVHMIAQTAHCIAQGKVGSGFDVSSAVYSSHRHVPFSPEVISLSLFLSLSLFHNCSGFKSSFPQISYLKKRRAFGR